MHGIMLCPGITLTLATPLPLASSGLNFCLIFQVGDSLKFFCQCNILLIHQSFTPPTFCTIQYKKSPYTILMASTKPLTCLSYAFFHFKDNLQINTALNKASIPVRGQIKETTTRVYVTSTSRISLLLHETEGKA